jgi:predicted dehydrogenase
VTPGIAVLGCGLVGRKRALAATPGSVVALHDTRTEAAETLAAELAGSGRPPRVTANAADAIEADGVDLVVVATHHDALTSLSLAALDAGRHVLVEKPAARARVEAEHLARRARDARRVVRVGFNHRFHPAITKAGELSANGRYGRLLHVRARYGHGGRLRYEHEWRASREASGGGELVDQGSHLVDLFRVFAGDARLVFAELRTSFWPMEVEDNAFLAVEGASGAFGWLHASWTEWKNLFSLELTYERAKLDVSGLGGSYGTEHLACYEMRPEMGPPPVVTWEWEGPDTSWADELDDVVAALRGEPSRGASIDDAVAVWRIVDAAQRTRTRTSEEEEVP